MTRGTKTDLSNGLWLGIRILFLQGRKIHRSIRFIGVLLLVWVTGFCLARGSQFQKATPEPTQVDTLPSQQKKVHTASRSGGMSSGSTGVMDFTKIDLYPPESASLMRYVSYPVSTLTGIPDIRIPLYTVCSGAVTVPIELSFHMDNYLRVNQLPGSAGAGWSLSSELQISRVINGLDDFKESEGKIGYYHNIHWIESNYTGANTKTFSKSDRRRMAYGLIDTEPDKFFYRLPGKTGSFYFQHQPDNSKKPVAVPYNGVRIEYSHSNRTFTLTDTDGTQYLFSSQHTDRVFTNSVYQTTMSWKCNRIVAPTGQTEVTFDYTTYTYNGLKGYNGRIEIYDDQRIDCDTYYYGQDCPECNQANLDIITDSSYPWWKVIGPKMVIHDSYGSRMLFYRLEPYPDFIQMTDGGYTVPGGSLPMTSTTMVNSYLKEINFRGGKVVYNYVDNHILSSIQIQTSGGNSVRTIGLSQPLTEVTSPQSSKYTRTLDELQNGEEKYRFTYGITRKGGAYMSDFWGYEGEASGVIIPKQTVEISTGECVSLFPDCHLIAADEKYTLFPVGSQNLFTISPNRTLLTIGYPTGGRAEFTIGQNRYKDRFDNNTIKGSGGYRIEEIRYYETAGGTTPVRTKRYKYGESEDGTGIPRITPLDGLYSSNLYTQVDVGFYYGTYKIHSARKRIYSNTSIQSKTFDNGAAVNYDHVSEYEYDNGSESGKVVYTSDMHHYNAPGATPTSPYPLEEDEWFLGMPESTVWYKYKNGQYYWTKKVQSSYNKYFDPIQIYRGRCHIYEEAIELSPPVPSSSHETFLENFEGYSYGTRGVVGGIVQLKQTLESDRDDDGTITVRQTNYFYDGPKEVYPSRIERSLSNGSVESEHRVYPYSYLPSSGEGGFLQSLINGNMIENPIEVVKRRDGKITDGVVTLYNNNGTIASVSTLRNSKPTEGSFKLSNRPQGNYVSNVSLNTTFSKSPLYAQQSVVFKYDSYGNPVNVIDSDRQLSVCYLWSYMGKYPVAEILNAGYAEVMSSLGGIAPESLSSQVVPNLNQINGLRNHPLMKNARITTYTYEPLKGMVSSTSAEGETTYYSYDSQGRLSRVYLLENGVARSIKEYHYQYR